MNEALDKENEEARVNKDFDYNKIDYSNMVKVLKGRPKVK